MEEGISDGGGGGQFGKDQVGGLGVLGCYGSLAPECIDGDPVKQQTPVQGSGFRVQALGFGSFGGLGKQRNRV